MHNIMLVNARARKHSSDPPADLGGYCIPVAAVTRWLRLASYRENFITQLARGNRNLVT